MKVRKVTRGHNVSQITRGARGHLRGRGASVEFERRERERARERKRL